MNKLVISLTMIIMLIPAASFAKPKAPGVLDDEKIITNESLSKYKTVGVEVFSIDDVKYDNVDDQEKMEMKRHLKEWRRKLARTIADDLKDSGVNAFVIEDSKDTGKADMVIEGSITKVNLGSAGARVFFGWGAGQAGLDVKGELKDAKSGDSLAKFGHSNTSGLKNGEKWDLVSHEVDDLGDKIAEFVIKLRK